MVTKKHGFRWREIGLVLLYFGIGIASALLWARYPSMERTTWGGTAPRLYSWHQEIISGHAPAPNQYRALTPWLAEGLRRIVPKEDVFTAYFLLRALFTGLLLVLFDRYMRHWFTRSAAAAGALCLATMLPFTYYAVIQESDLLNLTVLTAAFLAIASGRDRWLFPLTLLGTLNRETALMIPAVYFLARWGEQKSAQVLLRTAGLVACWAVVFGGLKLIWPPAQHPSYTKLIMWPINTASWLPTVYTLIFLGVIWFLPFFVGKEAPLLLRRTRWLVPLFVALHYVVAVVQEVRLFLPLTPILIPLSWWIVFPEARLESKSPEALAEKTETRR